MLKIQIDELEIFTTVVNSENFSEAALLLGLSSSVVSRTIKKLEKKLDTSLFSRTTRKIRLTQEGEWLFQHAKSITATSESIESYFTDKNKTPTGQITIDAATPFALHAIAPLLPKFHAQYPSLTVYLQSTESKVDLINHKVDIAIRIGSLNDSTLKARKLGESKRKLYAAPSYLERNGTPQTPDDIRNHTCLAFSKPEHLNTWPIKDSDGELITVNSRALADNGDLIKQLAIQAYGIACISSFTAKDDVAQGRLVSLLEEHVINKPIPIYAVFYSEKEVNNRIRCFLDYLCEHVCFG
jgi:DNA-binding transcriptional LysR family regulator